MIYEMDYSTVIGYECLNSCLLSYFNYKKMPINGFDIFFIGDGFRVDYNKDRKTSIKTLTYKANFQFMNEMKIPYTLDRVNIEGKKERLNFLIDRIRNNKMISIKVASNMLNYSPAFRQVPAMVHFINPIGYDEKQNSIFISDGDVPTHKTTAFEGWVDAEEILNAWGRLECEYLEIDDSFSKYAENIETRSTYKMKEGIMNYLNGGHSNDGLLYLGQDAILKLCDDLLQMEKDATIEEIKELAISINYQIRVFGFISSKKFIIEKLQQINIDDRYIENYKDVVSKWNLTCMQLARAGISGAKDPYFAFKQKVINLVQQENEILNIIYESICSIETTNKKCNNKERKY